MVAIGLRMSAYIDNMRECAALNSLPAFQLRLGIQLASVELFGSRVSRRLSSNEYRLMLSCALIKEEEEEESVRV